jgi:hypothetical protein
LDAITIDLGFVIEKSGYIKLAVPYPPGITKKDRPKATIVQGTPGTGVNFRNQLLTGKPGTPGTYTFTVEYLVPKAKVVSTAIAPSPFGISENGSVVTVFTKKPHRLAANQSVMVAGVGDQGYNGTFIIASVPNSKSFTYTATAGLGVSGGGFATKAQVSLVRVRYSYTVLN